MAKTVLREAAKYFDVECRQKAHKSCDLHFVTHSPLPKALYNRQLPGNHLLDKSLIAT